LTLATSRASSAISQTQRGIVQSGKVAEQNKVVSIFEPHIDVIVKDRLETITSHGSEDKRSLICQKARS
jgi:hypothetical protein